MLNSSTTQGKRKIWIILDNIQRYVICVNVSFAGDAILRNLEIKENALVCCFTFHVRHVLSFGWSVNRVMTTFNSLWSCASLCCALMWGLFLKQSQLDIPFKVRAGHIGKCSTALSRLLTSVWLSSWCFLKPVCTFTALIITWAPSVNMSVFCQDVWSWRSLGRTCTLSLWRPRWMKFTCSSCLQLVRAEFIDPWRCHQGTLQQAQWYNYFQALRYITAPMLQQHSFLIVTLEWESSS